MEEAMNTRPKHRRPRPAALPHVYPADNDGQPCGPCIHCDLSDACADTECPARLRAALNRADRLRRHTTASECPYCGMNEMALLDELAALRAELATLRVELAGAL